MNKKDLKDIKALVQKYAEVISNVIGADVEVIDFKLDRIAGTGRFKDKVGDNIRETGYIYSKVLETKKQYIVENPGKNKLCKHCENYGSCVEKMQINTPIIYGDKLYGIIGIICTNDDQVELISKNKKNLLMFTEQIAEFVGIRIHEENESEIHKNTIEYLKQILNVVDNGVISINNENEIRYINSKALNMLGIDEDIIGKTLKIDSEEEYFAGGQIFSVKIDGNKYDLIGQILPAHPFQSDINKIFIFQQIKRIKKQIAELASGNNIINSKIIMGNSEPMKKLKEKILKVSNSKSTVLITGESGTGKEVIARAIHAESDRKNKPFIAINCGAIPESLLESELFGYVRGAFSGASPNGRMGKFELANNGIIFLDEIGDMPLYLQVKILRVLQDRRIVRIGSNQLVDLDIRVIAATNKNLKKMVEEGKFREDLYYRLNVIPMELPPLREREGDLDLLVKHLVVKYGNLFGKTIYNIDEEVMDILKTYDWPGNIRELENVVEAMINLCDESGVLRKEVIPQSLIKYLGVSENKSEDKCIADVEMMEEEIQTLREIEMNYIKRVLKIYGDDTKGKKLAAKKLGIGIATLYRKLGEE